MDAVTGVMTREATGTTALPTLPTQAGTSPTTGTTRTPDSATDLAFRSALAAETPEVGPIVTDSGAMGCQCGTGDGAELMGPDGVPADLRPYGAAQAPLSAMQPVTWAPGQVLWPPAASSLDALHADALADGVRL
ncbi:hypothetical protein N869_13495, partial [Cellulomonas bogoriensis 69B4 = DSM 16987]